MLGVAVTSSYFRSTTGVTQLALAVHNRRCFGSSFERRVSRYGFYSAQGGGDKSVRRSIDSVKVGRGTHAPRTQLHKSGKKTSAVASQLAAEPLAGARRARSPSGHASPSWAGEKKPLGWRGTRLLELTTRASGPGGKGTHNTPPPPARSTERTSLLARRPPLTPTTGEEGGATSKPVAPRADTPGMRFTRHAQRFILSFSHRRIYVVHTAQGTCTLARALS